MPSDDAGLVSPGTEVDDSSASGESSPDTSPTSGGFNSWSKNKKMAAGGGVVAVGLVLYLYMKHKSSTAASTSASGTTPTLVLPSSNQDAQMSSAYAGLSNQLSQILAQTAPSGTTTTPTPTGSPTTVQPISFGPGGANAPGAGPPQTKASLPAGLVSAGVSGSNQVTVDPAQVYGPNWMSLYNEATLINNAAVLSSPTYNPNTGI